MSQTALRRSEIARPSSREFSLRAFTHRALISAATYLDRALNWPMDTKAFDRTKGQEGKAMTIFLYPFLFVTAPQ